MKTLIKSRKMLKADFFLVLLGLALGIIITQKSDIKNFFNIELGKTVEQCYTAECYGDYIYIVDAAHERISAVDSSDTIVFSIENSLDKTDTSWYIDSFSVAKDGTLYLACTEWDGFFLSKEAILKYDHSGKFIDYCFYTDYEKSEVNKHRIAGINAGDGAESFLYLNDDSVEKRDFEGNVIEYCYENAFNEVGDARFYGGDWYVLDKKGYIFNLDKSEKVFSIYDIGNPDGIAYRFDISDDGRFFYTDIKNNAVFSYKSGDADADKVLSGTDTLTVFTTGGKIYTSDSEHVYEYDENTDGEPILNRLISSLKASNREVAKGVLMFAANILFLIDVVIVAVRGFFVLKGRKISGTIKTEIAIVGIVATIVLVLVFMMIKQFKATYRANLFDQISMTAYSIASVTDAKDIQKVDGAADFAGEAYERVWNDMDTFFFKDIALSSQMYCNILRWDGDTAKPAYAIAYYDQSIGTYFPLDSEETEEVIRVYETLSPVWNEGKEDVAGTFLYIKVPVFNEDGTVGGVVSVGMDTYIMDSLVTEMKNNTLLSIATILLLILIAGMEVVAIANARNKFEKIVVTEPDRKALPVHIIRILVFTVFAAYNMSAAFLPVYVLNHSDIDLPFDIELVASLPITVNIFILGVMSLFCSKMVRKLGIKKLAILSGLASFAGNLVIMLIPAYFAIFAGLILDGIGVGLMSNAIYIIITYVKNEEDRTEGFATYNAGCISGINFGMMLGAILAVNIGQKYVFAVVAGLWLVIIELVVLICKQAGNLFAPDEGADEESDGTEKKVGILLKDKMAMAFFILIQNPYIVFNSFVFYFVPIFCDRNGYNETMTSILLMVYSVCAVYLSDVLTRKSLELFKDSSMHIAYTMNIVAVVIYAWTQNMSGLIIALVIFGISASFGKSVQQTYFIKLKSVKKYGEDNSMGVYNFTENIGESLGPIIFSYLMAATAVNYVVSAFAGVIAACGGTHLILDKRWNRHNKED